MLKGETVGEHLGSVGNTHHSIHFYCPYYTDVHFIIPQ